jgi:hypothetical protein
MKDGIELGPFEPREILDLLYRRTISPDAVIIELNSRRMCAVSEVGPFAQFVLEVLSEQKKQRERQDFEKTKETLARTHRMKVLIIVGVAVLLAAIAAVMLFLDNPFWLVDTRSTEYKGDGESKNGDNVNAAAGPAQPEFAIRELDVSDQELSEESNLVKSLTEEHLVEVPDEALANGEKLKKPRAAGTLPKPAGKGGKAAAGAPRLADAPAGDPGQGEEEGVTTLDFTDEGEGDGGDEAKDAASLARNRLYEVVRDCAIAALTKYPDMGGFEATATVTLEPTGRLAGLKLDVTTGSHVGEIKLCANAELARKRVPPTSAEAMSLSVPVSLSAPK